MHRAFSVPRWIGRSSLVLSLILQFGMQSGSAQSYNQPTSLPQGQASREFASTTELEVGMSRAYSMSNRAQLKRVENANSSVVRVEKVADSNNEVMLFALSPGRTTILFTDLNDRVERHELIVAGGAPASPVSVPVATVQTPDGGGPGIIYMKPGATQQLKSQLFVQAPKSTFVSSNARVVSVESPKEQNILLLRAGVPGTATVTVTDGKINETFEVIVTAPIHELQGIITRLVPTASVSVAESGNTLVVSGTVLTADDARLVKQLSDQANAISNIKIGGVQQVQLEVLIAVVNRTEARNMSFSFAQNGSNWFISSLFGGPFATGSAIASGIAASTASIAPVPTATNVPFGIINNNNSFLGFLNCLRTESLAKIIAEPRVVTLSGRPAYIVSGGETPILTSAGQGAPSVSYKQFGTVVNFLPIVLGNGKIHLEVRPELSDIDNTVGISIPGVTPTIVPGFRTRSAQVAVQIEDGQTLAIGGLIQNTVNASIDRIPVLGDLPGLGTLFSRKSYVESEQELIILVTPRLVDPVDCTKIPRYLPGRETRSPDDFELFLEGILEAPRGPRNVTFRPHHYKPAFHGAPNINEIPCGDESCRRDVLGPWNVGSSHRASAQPSVPQYTTSTSTTPSVPQPAKALPSTSSTPPNAQPMPTFSSGSQPSQPIPSFPSPAPNSRPMPNLPSDFQPMPVASPRRTESLPAVPTLREAVPTFGPSTPLPSREYDNVRPPTSPGTFTPPR